MSDFKTFRRKGQIQLREVTAEEIEKGAEHLIDVVGVSISPEDIAAGSPKVGDMVALNPENDKDLWLVAKDYFEKNYEQKTSTTKKKKTLHNSNASGAKDNVKDIIFWGNGDMFKLISKASSEREGWMKSTKAMEIKGLGCVVQVTTQQGENIAEAVTFVPGAKIKETFEDNKVVSRQLTV